MSPIEGTNLIFCHRRVFAATDNGPKCRSVPNKGLITYYVSKIWGFSVPQIQSQTEESPTEEYRVIPYWAVADWVIEVTSVINLTQGGDGCVRKGPEPPKGLSGGPGCQFGCR